MHLNKSFVTDIYIFSEANELNLTNEITLINPL